MRQVVARAQGLQDVTGFKRRGGASRPTGNRDVVDAHQQAFALDIGEADVQVVRQAVIHRPVDVSLVEFRKQFVFEPVPQFRRPGDFLRHAQAAQLGGFPESHNAWNVQCA